MLKKILSNVGYLALMLCLGFGIYYYLLSPNAALKKLIADKNSPSSQTLFESKLPNENGVNQDLSQFKGKIIVLNFWATWCPPCREEIPELAELYAEYKNKNVVVLGIAVDTLLAVREFKKAMPISYPVLVSEDEGSILNTQLGNNQEVLPYTVIINANGKVLASHFGRINKAQIISNLRPLLAK